MKSRTVTEAVAKRHGIRLNIRCATFTPSPDFYIAGILLLEVLCTPKAMWLIPSLLVESQAVRSKKDAGGSPTRRVIACNPLLTAKDQWSPYMSAKPASFVLSVIQVFDQHA